MGKQKDHNCGSSQSKRMIALACDLGGTRMKIGVVRDGKVAAHTVEPSNSKGGLRPRLPVLKAAWLRLLGDLQLSLNDCAGVSISFPSLVNTHTARVIAQYGKFDDATDIDFRAWAKEELRLPLAIENEFVPMRPPNGSVPPNGSNPPPNIPPRRPDIDAKHKLDSISRN